MMILPILIQTICLLDRKKKDLRGKMKKELEKVILKSSKGLGLGSGLGIKI